MAVTHINQILEWFKTGKKPTQAHFWATWGSFWHKYEMIPQNNISNLTVALEAKEDKTQKGAPNGYAPLDEFTKLAAQYLNIVNDLVTGGATALLSAEQGKVLQTQISAINTLLSSDNVNLDTVQELVDAIETVQLSLSSILVNDLTTGGTTKALTAEMGKQLGLIKESTANKSTSFVVDYLSDIKFPSVKAVYDFCMSAFKKKFLDFGDVSGIAHTFGVGSENTMYKFSNNNPITATIPTNATTPFKIGTVFETIAIGNGELTVTGASGVTILTNLSNMSIKNEVRRYTKIDTDTWTEEGSLSIIGAKGILYLDAALGNDSRAVEGRESLPFKTMNAVINYMTNVPNLRYEIFIKAGTYTQSVGVPLPNNGSVKFFSSDVVNLTISVAPALELYGGTSYLRYEMPLGLITTSYTAGTSQNSSFYVACKTLTVSGLFTARKAQLVLLVEVLTLNSGILCDCSTGASTNYPDIIKCNYIYSTGTSTLWQSFGMYDVNIEFLEATVLSGTLVLAILSSGRSNIKFNKYTGLSFTTIITATEEAQVRMDFSNTSITFGCFNFSVYSPSQVNIIGNVTFISCSYLFFYGRATLANCSLKTDGAIVYRSGGNAEVVMINSIIQFSGTYYVSENTGLFFASPVLTAVGNNYLLGDTSGTFFNFHPEATNMQINIRGSLRMNNTTLPPGLVINSTPTNNY